MSSYGWQTAQLAAQRMEELRLLNVRTQCHSRVTECTRQVQEITDPAVQQLAAAGLQTTMAKLASIRETIEAQPDASLTEIEAVQRQVSQVVAQAEAKAHQWSQEQAQSQARIEEASGTLRAEREAANDSGKAVLAQAEQKLETVRSLHARGRYADAMSACDEVSKSIAQAAEASLDETVRKEVVRSLIAALKEKGFVIDGPRLRGKEDEGGVVTLTGQLPSGKKARFEVRVDGRMKFDMDGYEGRSCAKELDGLRETLDQRFAVKMTPQQVIWKNPDKLTKGALTPPTQRSSTR